MPLPLARLRRVAFVPLLASACSLDGLADGTRDTSSASADATTVGTSSAAESSSTGDLGGAGGGGGMAPSMFSWAEAIAEPGEQKAEEAFRPLVVPYKEGFVVALTSTGANENDIKTRIRAYEPKAMGTGFDLAWENVLVEHAVGVADGNLRRKRALDVGGDAVGLPRVVIAGTYWKGLELDGVPVFDGPDITNQAGFYVVLEDSNPASSAAVMVDRGRTKQSTYVNAVALDDMGHLFLGGATNPNGLIDPATLVCAAMPAITVADSAFVIARPNTSDCSGVVFSPVGARTSQGVHALLRQGNKLFAAGLFAPAAADDHKTLFATGMSRVRNGTSGSDIFVTQLSLAPLEVDTVYSFGRADTSDSIADVVVDAGSRAWIAGTGGTQGCTNQPMEQPNGQTNFVVSVGTDECREEIRLGNVVLPANPPFRSLARFTDGAEDRLWISGDYTIANTLCDPQAVQPMTRSGYLLALAVGAEPGGPKPEASLAVATTLPLYFARALRLGSGEPLVVGSFANEFDPMLPTPPVGNGNDFFLGQLAGPLPDACSPP